MFTATYTKRTFHFNEPGGTSRGVLREKLSYFIRLGHPNDLDSFGIGECSLLPGLSPDDRPDLEEVIQNSCAEIEKCANYDDIKVIESKLQLFPALRFAIEMARFDLQNGGKRLLFPSAFTNGEGTIPINGLVWMGDIEVMKARAIEKLNDGFECLKFKIGALDFEKELELLRLIRKLGKDQLIIRVDANGAFHHANCYEKLKRLADINVHSIEQPIPAGQTEYMQEVCANSPLPIALDEELIGFLNDKYEWLKQIKPQYVVLKPSLLGGFQECKEWIDAAEKLNIGWWVTSALESNLGLNAISQWTYTLNSQLHQGLGTGKVFSNNITSPLTIRKAVLRYEKTKSWDEEFLLSK